MAASDDEESEDEADDVQSVSSEDRPRPRRRLRSVPSASFEPEDLTVTKERDINLEDK